MLSEWLYSKSVRFTVASHIRHHLHSSTSPRGALIFGASGQDGHSLVRFCAARCIESLGVSRSASADCLVGDVAKREQVEALIGKYQPEYVFHLAAHSTTRHDTLYENHETISTGTLNILEAVK